MRLMLLSQAALWETSSADTTGAELPAAIRPLQEASMKHFVIGTATLALMALASAPAMAASPSQAQCENAGGTYTKVNGTVSCTFTTVDPVGNSEKSGGKSQTTTSTEEESSQGTLNNKPQHEESSTCKGPGSGQSTGQCDI